MRYTGVLPALGALVLAASLVPTAMASAGDADGKRSSARRGYGFLPGYEPPDLVEWRNRFERRPGYWWGGPQFYRGRQVLKGLKKPTDCPAFGAHRAFGRLARADSVES